MASFRLTLFGWRAEIFRRGIRKSQSAFKTKAAAVAWAGRVESEIMAGVRGEIPDITVQKLLDRYLEEVSRHKKGRRWESIRLQAVGRDRLASVRLRQLDSPHVAEWQERRLKAVSGASVKRERNLLNNVFEIARKEWRWISRNPFQGVRRPKDSKPRNRIASQAEIDTLCKGASGGLEQAIVIALETGMRCSEIPAAHVKGRVAFLADSKTGVREVPLSLKAVEAFAGGVNLTAGSISALFARLCKDVKIEGLTFHDLRHTAVVRLAKKLSPFELAKMVGHRDLKMTLNVYYQQDAEETAKKL